MASVPQPINVTSPSVSVCLKIMVKWPNVLQTSTVHYTTLTAHTSQMIRLHHGANVNRLSPAGSLLCVKLIEVSIFSQASDHAAFNRGIQYIAFSCFHSEF